MSPNTGYTYTDHLPADFSDRELRADVLTGLGATPKWLPPKWFYDKVGSELFEDITRLPEYYPTRTERSILERHAAEMIGLAGCDTLIELGSGSSEKTRLLLDAMTARGGGAVSYVALDVSEDALRSACAGLVAVYPQLRVAAVRADFTHQLACCRPAEPGPLRSSGRTIGNFEPAERAAFLRSLRASTGGPGHLPARCRPGEVGRGSGPRVRRRRRSHRRLQPQPARRAEPATRRRLRPTGISPTSRSGTPRTNGSRCGCGRCGTRRAHLAALDLDVRLDRGEDIRTEISAKFRRGRAHRGAGRQPASSRAAGGPTSRTGSRCPSGPPAECNCTFGLGYFATNANRRMSSYPAALKGQ